MLGSPVALGLLELGHPAVLPGENIFETLAPITSWWIALHVLQIPLFGLLGLAVLLLLRGFDSPAAEVSRWAIRIFIAIYPAFDAAVGVASGIVVRTAGTIDSGQRGPVEAVLQALFWGPVTGSLALAGSTSWLVSLFAAAWAWRRNAPLYTVAAFVLSGALLAFAHIRPFGPLACLFFLLGAAWVVFRGSEREAARRPI